MKVYFIILVLFLNACSIEKKSKENIEVYAINMMFACECPQYRVFESVVTSIDVTSLESVPLKNRSDIDLFSLKDKELDEKIAMVMEMEKSADSILGQDFDLVFESVELKDKFEQDEGYSPICNIYYLNGILQDDNTILVKDFKVLPKTPKCDTMKPIVID